MSIVNQPYVIDIASNAKIAIIENNRRQPFIVLGIILAMMHITHEKMRIKMMSNPSTTSG